MIFSSVKSFGNLSFVSIFSIEIMYITTHIMKKTHFFIKYFFHYFYYQMLTNYITNLDEKTSNMYIIYPYYHILICTIDFILHKCCELSRSSSETKKRTKDR